jgi:DNA-binding XRE family transcriptional regulator
MVAKKAVNKREMDRAMELLGLLAKDDSNLWVQRHAKRLHDQMNKPMAAILRKIKADTDVERAKICGVSRQALFAWKRGISRPNPEQAKRLAKLTGLTVEQIRGREEYTPPRVTEPSPKPKRKRKPKAKPEPAVEEVANG